MAVQNGCCIGVSPSSRILVAIETSWHLRPRKAGPAALHAAEANDKPPGIFEPTSLPNHKMSEIQDYTELKMKEGKPEDV